MMGHIYVLRHLETKNNLNRIINGQSITLSIYEERNISRTIEVDKVICSIAFRCMQTVECIVPPIFSEKVCYSPFVLERNMGRLEGMSKSKAISLYPYCFNEGRFDVFSTPPEGESYEEFITRVKEVKNKCSYQNKNILICSHNQFLKALYFLMHNKIITNNEWKTVDFPHGKIIKLM